MCEFVCSCFPVHIMSKCRVLRPGLQHLHCNMHASKTSVMRGHLMTHAPWFPLCLGPVHHKQPCSTSKADVVAQVLKQDGISVDADFFQIGGNSLLAGKVMSRISSMFEVSKGFTLIFEVRHPFVPLPGPPIGFRISLLRLLYQWRG